MFTIGTIRKFETARFTVIVDAVEDDASLDDLACDDESRDELVRNLDSGKWIQFCARARVLFDGHEIASDYLGGCVYESLDDFADHMACGAYNKELAAKGEVGRCGSYFSDMISQACAEARKHLSSIKSVHVRA